MSLSHEDVLEILALLDASGFDELRLETDRYKLLLRRAGAPAPPAGRPAAEPPTAAGAPLQPATGRSGVAGPPAAAAEPGAAPAATAHNGAADIISPMLGTFYRSPKPGEPPFIEIGSIVGEESVVGIVEVMKLMNSVAAGKRGTIVEIVARDGDLVEYGSVLARLAPEAANA